MYLFIRFDKKMYISYNIFLKISLKINNFNLLSNKRNKISLSINSLILLPIQKQINLNII